MEVADSETDHGDYSIFTYKDTDEDDSFGYYLSLGRVNNTLGADEILGVNVQNIDEVTIWLGSTTDEALDMLDVDKLGLDNGDRKILLLMIEKFGGGPVGLDTLSAALSEDAGTLEDVYEPYLLQNGFIVRTPKGRVVTDHAYAHLGIPHEEND